MNGITFINKKLGLSSAVEARARAEDKAYDQRVLIAQRERAQQRSEWYSREETNRRMAQRKRNEKLLKDNWSLANEELKLIRRAKLKQKLEHEYRVQLEELEMKGLTILPPDL